MVAWLAIVPSDERDDIDEARDERGGEEEEEEEERLNERLSDGELDVNLVISLNE